MGTNTAALTAGGAPPIVALTESWNGTNWTEVNDLNRAIRGCGAGGTQTSAVVFGGYAPSEPGPSTFTEVWNGTTWSIDGNMSQNRSDIAGFGTSTSAVAAGGNIAPVTAVTEEFTKPGFITKTLTS